jgi:hypothetical protein
MYHRSSSDELLAPSGELGIDESELFSGDKQRQYIHRFPPLPCLEASRSSNRLVCRLTLGVDRAQDDDQESKGRQNQDPVCAEVPPRE